MYNDILMWKCYSIKSFRDLGCRFILCWIWSCIIDISLCLKLRCTQAQTLLALTNSRRIYCGSVDVRVLCGAVGKCLVTVCFPFRGKFNSQQSQPPMAHPGVASRTGHPTAVPCLKPLLGTAQRFGIRLQWLLHPSIWHLWKSRISFLSHILPHCHWLTYLVFACNIILALRWKHC